MRDAEPPDIELTQMPADAGLMQIVRASKKFDVIVTDNLFGDLLSDAEAMLTGSVCDTVASGRRLRHVVLLSQWIRVA